MSILVPLSSKINTEVLTLTDDQLFLLFYPNCRLPFSMIHLSLLFSIPPPLHHASLSLTPSLSLPLYPSHPPPLTQSLSHTHHNTHTLLSTCLLSTPSFCPQLLSPPFVSPQLFSPTMPSHTYIPNYAIPHLSPQPACITTCARRKAPASKCSKITFHL